MDLFFSEQDISDHDINQIIRPKRIGYSINDLECVLQIEDTKLNNLNKKQVLPLRILKVHKLLEKIFKHSIQREKNYNVLSIYPVMTNIINYQSSTYMEILAVDQKRIHYHVCAYDSSGCGLSEGNYVTLGINERDDLHSVINQLKQQFGYTKFILWGRSMGAVTCLLYCMQLQGMYMFANNNNGVVSLVIDSAFSNFGTLSKEIAEKKISSFLVSTGLKHLRNKLKKVLNGIDLFDINLTNSVSQLKLPAIFAYSDQDQVVSSNHTHILFDNYGGPKQKTSFKGDHNSMRDANYYNSITNFLNNQLQIYKNSTQSCFNNIENFQMFNKNMNISSPLNVKPSMKMPVPSKLNSISLSTPQLFNIQQSTTKYQAQTQKNIATQQMQNMQEYGFQQYISLVNNQNQQQQQENLISKDRTRTENIESSSNKIPLSPFNINQKLAQSVDNLSLITNQKNQSYVTQTPQTVNKSFINNENRIQTTNDINSSFIYSQTPGSNQNKQIYQNSQTQYQILQPSNSTPLIQKNTVPVNMLPSNNTPNIQNASIPVVMQGQQYIKPPQIGQIKIASRQENKTTMKRSLSTAQFIRPSIQQFGNNSFQNIKPVSFVQNNNPQLGNYYQTQIQQKSVFQPGYPLNFQINNRIMLK